MDTVKRTNTKADMKGIFSTLWIFLSVNYIYCDHLGLMEPEVFQGLMTGHIGAIQITQGFLLASAILLEIPFVMIVLSRVLKYRANRWANIIAGAIMAFVQIGTMGMGTSSSLAYIFYSVIEIVCNLLIVWLAWKWHKPESEL